MSDLTGKVAIVTGASKGIGAGIAKALAGAGAAVAVNYAGDQQGADRVVEAIIAKGGKAAAIQADVSNAADVRRLFAATKQTFGALDVLVNNAAVFSFGPIEAVTEDEFHRQFNTNVLGVILTIQEALKYFGPAGGAVINISSLAGANPGPNATVYAGTKGALNAITRGLGKEFGARNIRINAIAPGGVETEGSRRIGVIGSDLEKRMIASTPLGRLGQPDDIARVAVFLASDDARWLTGETITAAGGA